MITCRFLFILYEQLTSLMTMSNFIFLLLQISRILASILFCSPPLPSCHFFRTVYPLSDYFRSMYSKEMAQLTHCIVQMEHIYGDNIFDVCPTHHIALIIFTLRTCRDTHTHTHTLLKENYWKILYNANVHNIIKKTIKQNNRKTERDTLAKHTRKICI